MQYLSIRYTDRLTEAGILPSVGSVGDSYDNALAETINGLYKTEVIRKDGPWRGIDPVEYATLEWVDWFNNRRLLGPIGNIPPAEYEKMYYDQIETPAAVAGLNPSTNRVSGEPGAVHSTCPFCVGGASQRGHLFLMLRSKNRFPVSPGDHKRVG